MKKTIRTIYLILTDILLIILAYDIAFFVRFDNFLNNRFYKIFVANIIIIVLIKIGIISYFKLYRSLWKYASIEEIVQVVLASIVSNTLIISILFIKQDILPRSIYLVVTMLDIFLISGSRFSYRIVRTIKNNDIIFTNNIKRVLVIGAGDAGATLIRELRLHTELRSKPIAIIDDNYKKIGRRINGVPVLGNRNDIIKIVEKKKIDEIIIAIPSANKIEIRDIVQECKKTNCKTKIAPSMSELIDGKISISNFRDVEISDLLGREEINLNLKEINNYIKSKRVLVTGGGGSIGSELCRQIAKFNPKELVILDIYENNAYDVQNELMRKYENINLKVIIASVRDKDRVYEVIEKYRPNLVFHAAAHKHVPLMEDNPKEAIKNNVYGTLNLVEAVDYYNVEKFVLISSDKAVNPTNIMGASKRICEMIVQTKNNVSNTEFVAVRFGNVLGSNGSVIPLFKKQISDGGPVTVTHPEVIRYFMTIQEATQLVMQAGSMAKGGEIFVLDMGEPVKIIDLAKDLIKLSGFEPNIDIPIKITGLRPGEKLYEELLLDEEGIKSTKYKKIHIGKPININHKILKTSLNNLRDKVTNCGDIEVLDYVSQIVPTYKNNKTVNKIFEEKILREISATQE